MQEKGQTATFPSGGDFDWVTVRGPCEFDVWRESTQLCIVESRHCTMANVKGMLKTAQQPSSQGSDGEEWGPHGSMRGGTNRWQ
jgi:hypothetical protein